MYSDKLRKLMIAEKSLEQFDLSNFTWFEHKNENFIDSMGPAICYVKWQGNCLDLDIRQSVDDVILPFRFLKSLELSRVNDVDNLQFIWCLPITLQNLKLDNLQYVPAADFVKHVPALSNQLCSLAVTNNIQLAKYDLVPMVQRFSKLDVLDISKSDYITPGTCDAICRYCYNLQKFLFSLDFRVSDCRAWVGLLGLDYQHIEFSDEVNTTLETYYMIERESEEYGHSYEEIDNM